MCVLFFEFIIYYLYLAWLSEKNFLAPPLVYAVRVMKSDMTRKHDKARYEVSRL